MRASLASSLAVTVSLLLGCSSATQGPAPPMAANAQRSSGQSASGSVYVADYGVGAVVVLDGTSYAPIGKITTSINGPQDVTLDGAGNLYVANTIGDDVTEYAPGSTSPKFTYSALMRGPVTVTVNDAGHVFVVNREWNGTSTINEYDQSKNLPLHSCSFTGQLEGAAPRENGDVFISYNRRGQGGGIAVYKGGLSGCHVTAFGVHLSSAGSLVLDNANNVIVPNWNGGRVVVIPPPYAKVARRFAARFGQPYHVSIDQANTTVLLVAIERNVLYAVDYTSGRVVKKIGCCEGVSIPYGAVRSPNDVH